MDVSYLLDGLNTAQREAVSAPPGHYLILAGAGSGKTRVLTQRIAWLHQVHNISLHSIFAVTFTNKAAQEMRLRVNTQLVNGSQGMWLGTFHGLAHRLLRLHWQEAKLPESFQVLDSDDQVRLVKRVMQTFELDETHFPPKQVTSWINSQKEQGRRAHHIQPSHDPWKEPARKVYEAYQVRCDRSGLVDFSELLLRSHELLRDQPALLAHYQHRFQEILVDEFQDTNTIQYAFIRLLAGNSGRVFVVGDDDQSIYGWRGARVENMQQFMTDFPQVQTIRLEQNYRSTKTILSAANAVISNNPQRIGKELWTETHSGELIDVFAAYNETDEARYVAGQIQQWVDAGGKYDDIAILYRSNAQSRPLEETLIAEQLPYRVYGGMRFFERAEIKDCLAYLRLLVQKHDDTAFERVVNMPTRGIGDRTLDELRNFARQHSLSLWEAAEQLILSGQLTGRANNALAGFLQLVTTLTAEIAALNLEEIARNMLLRTGLYAHYEKDTKNQHESRVDNLEEFVSVASRFVQRESGDSEHPKTSDLMAFLTYSALEAGEGQTAAHESAVQLMTLHSAKGLEFLLVFLVGLEEGIFPAQRTLDEANGVEEERRLAYVGITRARKKLVISYAEKRRIYGMEMYKSRSRFLQEIPSELLNPIRPVVKPSTYSSAASRGHTLLETPVLSLGQRVQHPTFGIGTVTACEGRGEHTRVHINFETAGAKWLVLSYAKLTIL